MVGLSRARFYELVKEGVFPPPVYCVLHKASNLCRGSAKGLSGSAPPQLRRERPTGPLLLGEGHQSGQATQDRDTD